MRTAFLSAALLSASICTNAQPQLETVVTGLTSPTDVVHAGDARLFIVERVGRIRILHPDGTLDPVPFLDITDRVLSDAGEQGLLGLAFHPQYTSNGRFYVYYTVGTGNGSVRLSRFGVSPDPDVAFANQETVLWSTAKPFQNHNGGDLDFGPDGFLYLAPGDGGGVGDPANSAQDLSKPLGKILRLNVDGAGYTVPANNPFVGVPGALPEIWARGLRNPWRFGFDRLTGDLWIGDVGQDVQEEVNFWPAGNNSGANFGWRCYEGSAAYNTTGCAAQGTYVAPVQALPQTDGGCSVIGGRVYRGSLYPSFQGKYIYTDFCHGRVQALTSNGVGGWTNSNLIATGSVGMASIGEDVNGELYFCNTNNGTVQRLIDTSAQVRVSPRVYLGGPYDEFAGTMRDDLRTDGLIPSVEPYTAMGLPRVATGGNETLGGTVLNTTGPNAIVDWVRVELRSAARPDMVVAVRHGLLQRDGDVVAANGTAGLSFTVGAGPYYVVVRHRNHLGCMTANAIALSVTTTTVDLTAAATPVWGTNARSPIGSLRALWPGNAIMDGTVRYTGEANDRDAVLGAIGGVIPTNTVAGYSLSDINLDGVVIYTGAENDRDRILSTIGGVIPTNTVTQQLP